MRLRSTKSSSTGYNVGASAPLGDADVLAYISALNSAGVTVSEQRTNAITAFIDAEKTSGRWNIHKRIYLPIWQNAVANAICMKSLTTGTFSGSILHEAKGVRVTSNSSGNMNTNTNLGALGITNTSYHFAMLLPDGAEENYSIPFNVNNEVNLNSIYPLWSDGFSSLRIMEKVFSGTYLTNLPSIMTIGNDSVAGNLYFKEHLSGSTGEEIIVGSVTLPFPSANLFILGRSSDGAIGMNFPIGAFSVSTELSSAQDAAYSTSLRTLWYSCVIGSDNPANAAEPNATAWVLMDGPFGPTEGTFYGGQSWRKMEPIGYFPYGNETYTFGDEVVRFDGGAWIYENATLGEIARAWSTAQYPWLATNWNNGFTAAKVTSTYEKTTNYPAVP